jgi:hypothetical protein
MSLLQSIALRQTFWLTKYFRQDIQEDKEYLTERNLSISYECKVNAILDRIEILYKEVVVPIFRDSWNTRNKQLKSALASELLEECANETA